jgi:hypothetical protein
VILELKKNCHLVYHVTFFDGLDGGDEGDDEDNGNGYDSSDTGGGSSDNDSNNDNDNDYGWSDFVEDVSDFFGQSPTLNKQGQTVAEAFNDFANGGFVGGFTFSSAEGTYSTNNPAHAIALKQKHNVATVGFFTAIDNLQNNQYSETKLGENTFFSGTDEFGGVYSGVYSDGGYALNESGTTSFGGTLDGVETTISNGFTVTNIDTGWFDMQLDTTYVTNFNYNTTYKLGFMANLGYEAFGVEGAKWGNYLGEGISLLSSLTTPAVGVFGVLNKAYSSYKALDNLSAFNTKEDIARANTKDSISFGDRDRNIVRDFDMDALHDNYEEYKSNNFFFDDDELELDVYDFLAGGKVYNYYISNF